MDIFPFYFFFGDILTSSRSVILCNLDFLWWCRISIPLILSLPETVYALTKKGQLKVFLLNIISFS